MREGLLICILISTSVLGDKQSKCSGSIQTKDGRRFKILDSMPTSSKCKEGLARLQGEDGKIYCLAKKPDKDKVTNLSCYEGKKEHCQCGRENLKANSRIMYGQRSQFHRYPWIVRLEKITLGEEYRGVCTGSIISKRAVLTAAHCLETTDGVQRRWVIVAGESEKGTGVTYNVSHHVRHGQYYGGDKYKQYKYDVALFITDRDIEYTENVGPICLPQVGETNIGDEVTMAGWGSFINFPEILISRNLLPPQVPESRLIENDDKLWKVYMTEDEKKNVLKTLKMIIPGFNNWNESAIYDKLNGFSNWEYPVRVKFCQENKIQFKKFLKPYNLTQDESDYLDDYYDDVVEILANFNDGSLGQLRKIANMFIEYVWYPKLMGETQAVIEDQDICDKLNSFTNDQMCLRPKLGEKEGNTCYGDSGGPAFKKIGSNIVQVGVYNVLKIVNAPIGCMCFCKDDDGQIYPSYYAKLEKYLDWIHHTLQFYNASLTCESRDMKN